MNAKVIKKKFRELKPLLAEYIESAREANRLRQIRDSIGRDILAGMEIYDMYEGKRITTDQYAWMAGDEDAKRYYAAMDKALRAAGIKPEDMETEYCPVLIAENKAREIKTAILIEGAKVMGVEKTKVFGRKREEFFEVTIGLITCA